jgi:hypothetical protein
MAQPLIIATTTSKEVRPNAPKPPASPSIMKTEPPAILRIAATSPANPSDASLDAIRDEFSASAGDIWNSFFKES